MGSVAARHSDVVFLTSDNPRTEDPSAILREVEAGLRGALDGAAGRDFRYHVIPDRRRAIAEDVREAKSGDMVLIAGKVHEDYQILGTERHHFDDREEARIAIEALRK
jgi:UDP-N-acetylmuramoyl-L-alanyl-D-glutamate--2,6-diaminopimelate ligase